MDFPQKELKSIKEKGLYRKLKVVSGEQGPRVRIDNREVILLSSNNYLGLASHPAVKEASCSAVKQYGVGSGASRLISGNSELYTKLEKKVAAFTGAEAALVFNSGYMANIGIISSLCDKNDIILCDRLNHASIIDGCLMSMAKLKRYPHKDVKAIEKILQSSSSYKKRLIVTDGLFSMDGDIAPVGDIVEIAKKYDALVMIDEAHAVGILGKGGRGTLDHFNISISDHDFIITMGTFGKAFGSFGAYAAGKKEMIDYLTNKSRNLIFTTALPSPVLAASFAGIEIVENNPGLRISLLKNADYLRAGLIDSGFNTLESAAQIIPVVIGDPEITMKISGRLFEHGIFVQGIRPPSVPEGTSRLRITVMANHTLSDIDQALDAMKKARKDISIGLPVTF